MQFLMGLNESYNAIRGKILLMNTLPSVRQAYSFMCQEEKQRLLSVTHTATYSNSSATMAVRSNQMKNNSAGNARSDLSDLFYSGSQDSRRFDQNKRSSGFSEGDLSAPIVGTWDTLLRNVISCTDILQDAQGQEQVPFLIATRILLWLIKFFMVQTKMMGNQW